MRSNVRDRNSCLHHLSQNAFCIIQEEWRVKMIPMQFLYLTCQPVVHITARCISESQDYPPEIPDHITKLLEFHIVSSSIQF